MSSGIPEQVHQDETQKQSEEHLVVMMSSLKQDHLQSVIQKIVRKHLNLKEKKLHVTGSSIISGYLSFC